MPSLSARPIARLAAPLRPIIGLVVPILLLLILAPPTNAQPREQILGLLAKHAIPGASVALIEGGNIAWARGYGVKELGDPAEVNATTLFQAGSISKPVAALCALVLVQQGRLGLDTDVNARLVSWRVTQNAFIKEQPVTVRLLLSHRAGAIVHGFPGYARVLRCRAFCASWKAGRPRILRRSSSTWFPEPDFGTRAADTRSCSS